MPTGSRTANTLKNSRISLIFYVIVIFLNFFSRKVFIDALGAEILGLNTTITNLLGLLNLSELGISSAVAFTLYAPIARNDRKAIQEIVSVQGWLYSIIAIIVIVGSVVMMAFFPMIFAKTGLPLWYAYATFAVFLFSALLGYFVNYQMIVLSASQKEYLNVIAKQLPVCIKTVAQIIVLLYVKQGYVAWLILEVIFAIVTAWLYSYMVRKEFPWLEVSISLGKKVRRSYPVILTKVKQLFFHKIGTFVLFQSSPLVIYGFTTLTMVAIYGNYMLVINGCIALLGAVFNGITPILGNLATEKNKAKELDIFNQFILVRFFLGAIVTFGIIMGADDFVTLWVGDEYMMPKVPFLLLASISYIQMTRPFDFFLSAYGRFEDIWAPVIEAAINLGGSILLGYFFGLTGIFIGILLSLLVIVVGWKGYFLATRDLEIPSYLPTLKYLLYTAYFAIIGWALYLLFDTLQMSNGIGILGWFGYVSLKVGVFALVSLIPLYLFDKNMKRLTARFIEPVMDKIRRR
ncbi:lipopolysaccharide biosynthesis protein [Porphyromonas levii]|uniref:lipopolysaccharide biosynthesis protein n=1 Tax=Porphyromonas levii TaxID=28114 RepID=UPI001B8C67C3|nr:sugar isomerase [Porphyromonas levii]MBR8702623.1 hypothetical protein [Porphyromonas levii]MBR8730955.1 hypothetical protein [Porphyromonas levii]